VFRRGPLTTLELARRDLDSLPTCPLESPGAVSGIRDGGVPLCQLRRFYGTNPGVRGLLSLVWDVLIGNDNGDGFRRVASFLIAFAFLVDIFG
jgi:hypothetical protein